MKVLVVGGGGREHALVWKISQSPQVDHIFCAPGNGGIARHAECVPIEAEDIRALTQFALREKIGLTVVGPELPLILGIVDAFNEHGLTVFGPGRKAAMLEGSKRYAKEFMTRHHIPTAEFRSFVSASEAVQAVRGMDTPFVVKADGLAAGKGVIVCHSRNEAYEAVDLIMKRRAFGDAGNCVIIEECLCGEEVSVLAVTDGEHLVTLPPAQDHKSVFDGDTGPNTGGMGAYAPASIVTPQMMDTIRDRILFPVIRGMKKEGQEYRGVLYAGLMVTAAGPKVLEFNCRFGDPETQATLPLLESDLVPLFMASINGSVEPDSLSIRRQSAVCVVMASGGYPGPYQKGKPIHGLDGISEGTFVFHSGTRKKGKSLLTSGGRVLGITAVEDTLESAIDRVYREVGHVTFDGAYYRHDIGRKALRRR